MPSSFVVIEFELCDIEDACDDCIVKLLKQQLSQLIHEVCKKRKKKGATMISLSAGGGHDGALLEATDGRVIDDGMLAALAMAFINHPRVEPSSSQPLTLIIHTFY